MFSAATSPEKRVAGAPGARDNGDYGIDAPGVIRNLALIGMALILLAMFGPRSIRLGPVTFLLRSMFWGAGILCLAEAVLMVLYAKVGKFHHRDKMLALVPWRGDEAVLDVGTGRGLMLVGAARRLTTGRATGLDIWSTKDLSGNALARTEANLAAEGVAERCDVVSEGAQKMSFADSSFDVVLSNLCIHNIPQRGERNAACREIARVLKPGGIAVISDYKNTSQYAEELSGAGLSVTKHRANWLTTFPPLTIVSARKAVREGVAGMREGV